MSETRETRPPRPRTTLMVNIHGACSNNGRDGAVARSGIFFAWHYPFASYNISLPVPGWKQTNNRAELYAAIIAVIHGKMLIAESAGQYTRLAVYSSSQYLVFGMRGRIRKWVESGWKTQAGGDVQNRDLWELLAETVKDFDVRFFEVDEGHPSHQGAVFLSSGGYPQQHNHQQDHQQHQQMKAGPHGGQTYRRGGGGRNRANSQPNRSQYDGEQ